MKKFNLLFIFLILLVGCRSTKKLTQSSAIISNQTEVSKKTDVKEESIVNNNKTSIKKTTITETQFETENEPEIKDTAEYTPDIITTNKSEPKRVVKSIKVTVIEEGTKDNSKIVMNKSDNSQIATKTEDKSKTEIKSTEKKSIPIPWKWIFAFGLLLTIGMLYFTKSPILSRLKDFISKLIGKK